MKPRNIAGLVVIGLLLGASPLMLWLGRWRLALAYAIAGAFLVAGVLLANRIGPPWPISWNSAGLEIFIWSSGLLVGAAAIMHALRINQPVAMRPWYSRWYIALMLPPIAGGAVALAVRLLLYQPFSTPSESGVPNLLAGDFFFASKAAYRSADPQRGDIAVFRTAGAPDIDYVKRIVGLPGDRIQMTGGVLHINGEPVKLEPAELPGAFNPDGQLKFLRETLPGGRSYVIADTGETLQDNTEEYIVPDGAYFALGDNRDNSQDSRFQPEFGFIPRQNFTGRLAFRFWNSNAVPLAIRPEEVPGQ